MTVSIKAATDSRNANANALFDALRAIQNAANIQWPDSAANRAIRAEFLIGVFPPSGKKGKQTPVTPPAPAATPAK